MSRTMQQQHSMCSLSHCCMLPKSYSSPYIRIVYVCKVNNFLPLYTINSDNFIAAHCNLLSSSGEIAYTQHTTTPPNAPSTTLQHINLRVLKLIPVHPLCPYCPLRPFCPPQGDYLKSKEHSGKSKMCSLQLIYISSLRGIASGNFADTHILTMQFRGNLPLLNTFADTLAL